MTMSTNNCESMTSYFTNSYMNSDMHGHYPGTGVDGLDTSQQMYHHNTHASQGNMPPYPRFPPYDRMGYYQQSMDPAYPRADSPSSQVGGVIPQQTNGTHPHQQTQVPQQQQPIVYASCKLQAATVGNGANGFGNIGPENGSPPLEQMGHHMNAQMTIPPHHMGHGQGQVHQNPQHMGMYNNGGPPGVVPQQQQQNMMHQQPPPIHQGQQPPPNSQNANSGLQSPLYPWMRSQFGTCCYQPRRSIDGE